MIGSIINRGFALVVLLLLTIAFSQPSQAFIRLCNGSRQVINCEYQQGYNECLDYYEGEGCRAVNCVPGYNNRCRATYSPRKKYCLQPFYPRQFCEITP